MEKKRKLLIELTDSQVNILDSFVLRGKLKSRVDWFRRIIDIMTPSLSVDSVVIIAGDNSLSVLKGSEVIKLDSASNEFKSANINITYNNDRVETNVSFLKEM